MTAGFSRETFRCFFETGLVFGLSLVFLVLLADTNGYEGDDLNSIVPMLHLPQAVSGRLDLYKFDWQPLAYWAGWAAYRLGGTAALIFLLPPLAIAASIMMLYHILTFRIGVERFLFLPVLLMFPEILYSGLYFNSSAMAYAFSVSAVALAFCGPGWIPACCIGVFLGLSVLFRLDFSLVVPAILVLRLYLTGAFWSTALAGMVAAACLGAALAFGLADMDRILDIYRVSQAEIQERAGEPGWDTRFRLLTATAIFSPVGWVFLAVAAVFLVRSGTHRLWYRSAALVISLLPFLLTMQSLLSVKYMMPVFVILPVFAGMAWVALAERIGPAMRRRVGLSWVGASVALLLVSVEPTATAPYLTITQTGARQIGTHDGNRSWGAYLWQMAGVELRDPPTPRTEAADRFVALAGTRGSGSVWLIGEPNYFSPGGLGWRYIYIRLELAGYRGYLAEDGTVRFKVPFGDIALARTGTPVPEGACRVVFDKVDDPAAYITQNCPV